MTNGLPITAYASAARTTTPTVQSDQSGRGIKGLIVVIDTTAVPSSAPSTVFTVEGKDPVSGKYFTLLASAAVTGVGTVVLQVFPGATASANLIANSQIPTVWRVKAVHGNANSVTYVVSVIPILK